MAVVVEQAPTKIVNIFYVTNGTDSPYQGRLEFTEADYAALQPGDLDALQLAQFSAWKANYDALRAAAAAAELLPPPIPQVITSPQARRAVLAAGLKDAVEAAVAGADEATQALWYTSDIVERTNPILNALAVQLGLSSAQLDALFVAGAGL